MADRRTPDLELRKTRLQRDNIRTLAKREPYRNYFSITEHDIEIPRFDGAHSQVMTRAAFVSGDAVSVLPYDSARDRVMLVEQFRFGPHVRGDQRPWKLEAIAGRIDPGENPQQTAHREMLEETGVSLQKLLPVAAYYPAPGAVAEYMFSFIGLAELPDGIGAIGGLEAEGEDIKSHVLEFDTAMGLLGEGGVDTGPLLISLLWLAQHRGALRKSA